jgi:hypothetical protein
LALLQVRAAAFGQRSLVLPPGVVRPSQFVVGRSILRPRTTTFGSVNDLVRITAGDVSRSAYAKFGAFARYWQASRSSRAGKAFEALIAFQENERLRLLGRGERILVTEVEGAAQDAADLLHVSSAGQIAGRSQAKLGWRAALAALENPKYAGLSIVTSRDSLSIIEVRLAAAKASSLRRGVPLAASWMDVDLAIRDGRLMSKLPSGAGLPTRVAAEAAAERAALESWKQVGRLSRQGFWATGGRVVGRTLVVVDYGYLGYRTYEDVSRYRSGDIGGGYLAYRGSLRVAQAYVTYVAIVDPEPFTKFTAAAGAIVLTVIDEASDHVYEQRRQAFLQILRQLDRNEQYHAVRLQLQKEARAE